MEITTGRRATPPRNHFAAARRWPLALLCGLLLLAGSALAQNDLTRRAPAPEASETQKASDPNETVTPLPQSGPTAARAPRPGGTVVDGDITFTSPGAFLYPRDIRLSDSYGVLRFFAADTLTTSPAGAAVQLFGNNADTFNGQLYLDSGAHNSAGIFFRTAGTDGTLTERMRVRSDGRIAINATTPLYSTMRVVANGSTVGLMAENSRESADGLYGVAHGNHGDGVAGFAGGDGGNGVHGSANGISGVGVRGAAYNFGGVAVHGVAQENATMAGRFEGNVQITGTLSKGGGSFKIDHPLDPTNKYLSHSFVESPDMMNIYNGVIVLDGGGRATVTLPSWFEALNRDYRYQLTAVGAPGPNLYIASEIDGNTFRIAGGKRGMKVSWQVTGVRHDAYAEAHRIPVEEAKPAEERGTYLHPEAFGQPAEKGVNRARHTTATEQTSTSQQGTTRNRQ